VRIALFDLLAFAQVLSGAFVRVNVLLQLCAVVDDIALCGVFKQTKMLLGKGTFLLVAEASGRFVRGVQDAILLSVV
jgi:hypothetical protein